MNSKCYAAKTLTKKIKPNDTFKTVMNARKQKKFKLLNFKEVYGLTETSIPKAIKNMFTIPNAQKSIFQTPIISRKMFTGAFFYLRSG